MAVAGALAATAEEVLAALVIAEELAVPVWPTRPCAAAQPGGGGGREGDPGLGPGLGRRVG